MSILEKIASSQGLKGDDADNLLAGKNNRLVWGGMIANVKMNPR